MTTTYPFICFHYIHQNPVKAGLVRRMEDWEMSSFRDYVGLRGGALCNKTLAYDLLEVPESPERFIDQSYSVQIIEDKSSQSSHAMTRSHGMTNKP